MSSRLSPEQKVIRETKRQKRSHIADIEGQIALKSMEIKTLQAQLSRAAEDLQAYEEDQK
jgi:predicted  nucleic acid-binding Zn-ribbon protein